MRSRAKSVGVDAGIVGKSVGESLVVRIAGVCLFVASLACAQPAPRVEEPRLGELIELLSGDGGYFDTDNLISNESAYGPAVGRLEPMGGAYLGVGPEQNFSYIARTRPSWAFLVDVRRDNMLQHLLLNAILQRSETPFLYLCHLFSRSCNGSRPSSRPRGAETDPRDLGPLIAAVESAPLDTRSLSERVVPYLRDIRQRLGVELSEPDRQKIASIYGEFGDQQLRLRFRSHGRPARWDHPTYRDLLYERTPDGKAASFLADLEGYEHLRSLALNGRLVPVVGDLSGPHALAAVGQFLRQREEQVSTLYVSNVEFYLMRSSSRFGAYLDNLRALPLAENSLIIRSYFDYGMAHPQARPGERSTLVLQRARRFLELEAERSYRNYWDVCTRDYLE